MSDALPESPSGGSVVRVRVRFGETDLMGIVHHASYVTYMEVARVEWLRRRGVTYALWAKKGVHLAVVELWVKYLAPARFDDELDVATTLAEMRVASARFEYRLVRSDGTLCASGSTRLAFVDDRQALRRFTPEMVEAMSRAERSL
ncbi:MAG: acyl-CoA thioesterase [Myxococcota bacterium]|nr:acyl-CoA thioesterase [Myxococcota bacterium]